ncbi:hypothetical protein [Gulosibacter molinativorax]|uniref:Histidine kinase n=1 Tax=Gulosibacter molinativorax TaxID=256821 RepID=A0ABT7CBM2_9MICO|nr:hypothetical protein [Gulosibacter molinativorax]MDJ1372544.1 hypothetical protein [Gulosibacter molinativorax]QUY62607.1 Hypotetical protein [Gulosibacter molinativorax]
MSEHVKSAPQWPIKVLRALLAVEALAMVAVTVLLIFELLTQPALSVPMSLALIVLAVIGVAFLSAIVVGVGKCQTWTRGAIIVWQVLQTATAVVILQGDMAAGIGWALAFLALAILLLTFHPTVTERLRRR